MKRLLMMGVVLGTMAGAGAQAATRCEAETAMPSEMHRSYAEGTQRALADHGFRPGPVDGKLGSRTRSAIRAYQKAAKLPVDGCVSQELINHLNFAEPKINAR